VSPRGPHKAALRRGELLESLLSFEEVTSGRIVHRHHHADERLFFLGTHRGAFMQT
jgi:hypothetical protein